MEQLPKVPHTILEGVYFPHFEFERIETEPPQLLTPELQFALRVTPQEGNRYVVDIRARSDPEKPTSFRALLIARLTFSLAEEVSPLSEEEMGQFLRRNSLILAWPYLREAISSATARMGLPPLFIGMLDVSSLCFGSIEGKEGIEPVEEESLEER